MIVQSSVRVLLRERVNLLLGPRRDRGEWAGRRFVPQNNTHAHVRPNESSEQIGVCGGSSGGRCMRAFSAVDYRHERGGISWPC